MSKEERQEKIDDILKQVTDLPEESKHFICGYMMRVNEELGKKEKSTICQK